MKGIVFTEFVEMMESRFSLEVADSVLDPEGLPSGGVYAATGTYDHAEMVTLITRLTAETGLPVPTLLRTFGECVFACFYSRFPGFFEEPSNTFEFLATINDTIHVAVRKLYPDAELPHFRHELPDDGSMKLYYSSPRGLADFAEGLILETARHYGETVAIQRIDLSDGSGRHVLFHLRSEIAEAA